jgi:hypothetical protein
MGGQKNITPPDGDKMSFPHTFRTSRRFPKNIVDRSALAAIFVVVRLDS